MHFMLAPRETPIPGNCLFPIDASDGIRLGVIVQQELWWFTVTLILVVFLFFLLTAVTVIIFIIVSTIIILVLLTARGLGRLDLGLFLTGSWF